MTTFNGTVGRIKSEIRRRLARGALEISALDVVNVMRSRVTGSARGAAVRRAFADLVEDGTLRATRRTEYNPDTRHSVTIYRAV